MHSGNKSRSSTTTMNLLADSLKDMDDEVDLERTASVMTVVWEVESFCEVATSAELARSAEVPLSHWSCTLFHLAAASGCR